MLRKHPMIQLTVGDATSHRQHTRSFKLFKASVSMHLKQRATNKPLNLHCLTWFCWHQKFQNTWWMSKTFFLNTLGNFNFARAQKKSTPCKTQCKMSIRTALERFWLSVSHGKSRILSPRLTENLKRNEAFKILLEPKSHPFAPRSTGAPAGAKLQVVNSDVPPTRKGSAAPCPDEDQNMAVR